MGQALYRAYRPKKLSEVVGQEHIATTLDRALKQGRISHAYLLTGPHGTGKTSIARILAHEINGLPYEEDRQHLDIIEIDAASNRRIEEIRDLRDKVHIAPTSAKYKVYIIDEVHMLTKEAFNALLKTLEEPPAHVVFILATTETHKLPATIISRTQRFAFKPIDQDKVVPHLKYIAKHEKMKIDDDALALIAAHGKGSFRDSISLLDQVRGSDKTITLADVQTMLGIAPADIIQWLMTALQAHDAVQVAAALTTIHEQGYEPAQVARQLGGMLREQLLADQSSLEHGVLMKLLAGLVYAPTAPDPKIALEITLLDAALAGTQATAPKPAPRNDAQTPAKPQEKPETKVMAEKVKPASTAQLVQEVAKKPKNEKSEKRKAPETNEEPELTSQLLTPDQWQAILASLKKHNTLHSFVKGSKTSFEPGKIKLSVSKAFFAKTISQPTNKDIILTAVKKVTGNHFSLSCTVSEATHQSPPLPEAEEVVHTVASTPKPKEAPPAAISNIFAGAELLES